MRPTLTPEHEAHLRATMEALGSQPGGERVWLSDNGRLLTSLVVARLRSAYWRASARNRLAAAFAKEAWERCMYEVARGHSSDVARFADEMRNAEDALTALGEKP
jgi:hypothetical protein